MSSFRFEDIADSFRKLRRFPLETAVSIGLAALCIFSIYSENRDEWVVRGILSLIVTFFLATGTTLLRESGETKKGKKPSRAISLAFAVFPIAYGIGFFFVNDYLGTESLEGVTLFLLHLTGFVAALFVAPYLGGIFGSSNGAKAKERTAMEYSNYFTLVAWTVLMSMIVGGSALALGAIAIGSVVTLFDLDSVFRVEKAFETWTTVSLTLLAPLYGLIHFPESSAMRKDGYETNRFFSFLVRFVGTPAIFVYFVILYAYSVRVLVNFHDWPKGVVSWMVIGFSSFGYLVYAFAKPYENGSRAIAAFRKFFPFAVLPQLFMLFYAISLRIGQYDLTMNRYFVVIFGVWLMAVSLYFAVSGKKSLTALPVSLALFSILVSFGPWSAFSLPLERQYDRLMRHMEQSGMLQEWKPVRLAKSIDAELENSIVSEIEYVCEYRDCAKLRPFFAKAFEDAEKKKIANQVDSTRQYSKRLSSWEASNVVTTELNVRKRSEGNETLSKYVRLSTKDRAEPYPLAVTGYDFVAEVVASGSISNSTLPLVRIDPDSETLTVVDANGFEVLPLADFTAKIRLKYGNSPSYGSANQEDLSFSLVSEKYEMKVFLREFSYKNPKYVATNPVATATTDPEKPSSRYLDTWYNISGIALLKKKGG